MKLINHFNANASTDLLLGRSRILDAILMDAEAMDELDDDYQAWLSVELEKLGPALRHLIHIKAHPNSYSNAEVVLAMSNIADQVLNAWLDTAAGYIDAQYENVDMADLREAEAADAAEVA